MKLIDHIIPTAFLVCVGLTACNADHPGPDGYSTSGPAGKVETVAQPNLMPAPQSAAPEGPAAKDSASTKPLDELSKAKENTTMPEALHGNNHSSPALKKSSLLGPKAPKVIWV